MPILVTLKNSDLKIQSPQFVQTIRGSMNIPALNFILFFITNGFFRKGSLWIEFEIAILYIEYYTNGNNFLAELKRE